MYASKRDLRSDIGEKEQRDIESFLEENMKSVLARSYFLINIIFVFLGVYVLILSPILFPSSTTNVPDMVYIPLIFSLGSITGAFILQMLSLDIADKNNNRKFTHKNGALQLKYGIDLRDRNNELNSVINKQLHKNEQSSSLIILSLLLFFGVMFLAKPSISYLAYFFFLCLLIIMCILIIPHGKTSQLPTKNTQCTKVTHK